MKYRIFIYSPIVIYFYLFIETHFPFLSMKSDWPHTFVSPSTDSRGAVVSYWRKFVHEVLTDRLGGLSLPRKSVVRLTDHPDMNLDVYGGQKTTTTKLMKPEPKENLFLYIVKTCNNTSNCRQIITRPFFFPFFFLKVK